MTHGTDHSLHITLDGSDSSSSANGNVSSPVAPPSPPTHTHPIVTHVQTGNLKPKQVQLFNAASAATIEPISYTQAAKISYWHNAMTVEYKSLLSNGTWHLIPPSSIQNLVSCRWVFKTKKKKM
jgi:hypothetical protein